MDFFTILEHNDHWRSGLHLLLVVKILGVSLFRRRRLPGTSPACTTTAVVAIIAIGPVHALRPVTALADGELGMIIVLGAIQGRPDELSVGKSFLFERPL